MAVWAQVFGALGVIGGIAVAVLLYYHRQTAVVWVTFTVWMLLGLWICLSWQNSINIKAAASEVGPNQSKTITKQGTTGEKSHNVITKKTPEQGPITQESTGTQSPNIIAGGKGTSIQITYDNLPEKGQNAHKDERTGK